MPAARHRNPARPLMAVHRGNVRLRGLAARDHALHAAHLLRLTAQDRRARFNTALSDDAILAYSRNLDWRHVWVFGAFVDGTLRGLAELIPDKQGKEAELSVSVERAYQHAGIGKLLSLAMVLIARRTGIGTIHIFHVPGNLGMRALARDLGATTIVEPGLLEGVVSLRAGPTPHLGEARMR